MLESGDFAGRESSVLRETIFFCQTLPPESSTEYQQLPSVLSLSFVHKRYRLVKWCHLNLDHICRLRRDYTQTFCYDGTRRSIEMLGLCDDVLKSGNLHCPVIKHPVIATTVRLSIKF